MAPGRYIGALATVARGSALPYGYTLTIWSTGVALQRDHGSPSVGYAFLFVVGAVAAFAVIALGVGSLNGQPLSRTQGELARAGIIQLVAVGLALGSAALISLIPGSVIWPLGGFTATLIYLLLAAFELVLVHREPDTDDG